MTKLPLLLGITAVFLIAGCRTDSSATTDAAEKAVSCAKCKIVWVQRPHQIGRITEYRSEKSMSCPDCKSAAENFFKTGKLVHTCSQCGGEVKHCTVH